MKPMRITPETNNDKPQFREGVFAEPEENPAENCRDSSYDAALPRKLRRTGFLGLTMTAVVSALSACSLSSTMAPSDIHAESAGQSNSSLASRATEQPESRTLSSQSQEPLSLDENHQQSLSLAPTKLEGAQPIQPEDSPMTVLVMDSTTEAALRKLTMKDSLSTSPEPGSAPESSQQSLLAASSRIHASLSEPASTDRTEPGNASTLNTHDGSKVLAKPPKGRKLFFGFDNSALSEDQQSLLEAHARYLTANPLSKVQLHGHSDATGPVGYNQILSRKRAATVAEYLQQKGVAEQQIEMFGWGSDNPLLNAISSHQHRRVEIVYLKEDLKATSILASQDHSDEGATYPRVDAGTLVPAANAEESLAIPTLQPQTTMAETRASIALGGK